MFVEISNILAVGKYLPSVSKALLRWPALRNKLIGDIETAYLVKEPKQLRRAVEYSITHFNHLLLLIDVMRPHINCIDNETFSAIIERITKLNYGRGDLPKDFLALEVQEQRDLFLKGYRDWREIAHNVNPELPETVEERRRRHENEAIKNLAAALSGRGGRRVNQR